MNSTASLAVTAVIDSSDLDIEKTLPCEAFDWCEGHDAWGLKHAPAERTHLGENKTIWHETTEGHRMDFDVLAQRMRIGTTGADTIDVSFEIDGRLSTLELPGFALALEDMAAKFRAIAAEVA